MGYDKKVFIIIVNWNGHRDTIECVESLRKLSYPNFEVLLVDNGSIDGSEEILRKKFPEHRLIQTGKNLGFTGGQNTGIRYALDAGADYLVLLNNDTVVAEDFLDALVEAAKNDSRAGMLSSKIFFYDRPEILWYAGAYFCQYIGWGKHHGYNQRDSKELKNPKETKRACGCSVMVSKELCSRVGLLDEDYFCYSEDIDWSLRCRKAGFKIMYVPASRVWHKISASTGGEKANLALYYHVRNSLRCFDKNKPLFFPLRLVRYTTIISIAFLSLYTMNLPKRTGIKRIYQGTRDFFQNVTGEFME